MDKKEIEKQERIVLFLFFTGILLMLFGFVLNWLIKNNLTPFEPTNSEIKSIIIVIFIFILFFVLIILDEELD
jgi:hypothetical protein